MACAVRGSAPIAKRSLRQWLVAIPPEEVRVVDERAEVVDGLDEELAGRDPEHGRVVPAVEPDEHVGVRGRGEAPEHPVQDRARDLGAAAPAAHGGGGGELGRPVDTAAAPTAAPTATATAPRAANPAEPPRAGALDRAGANGGAFAPRRHSRPPPRQRSLVPHRRKLLVLPHPAPVDPVLDAPHPAPFEREPAPGRDRVPVPARDEGEGERLRSIGAEGGARPRAAGGSRRAPDPGGPRRRRTSAAGGPRTRRCPRPRTRPGRPSTARSPGRG